MSSAKIGSLAGARAVVLPLVAAASLLASTWLAPARARAAVPAKPFGITFTMKTTEPTKEIDLGKTVFGEAFEFVNNPYSYTQAGGHPWGLTTTGEFTSEEIEIESQGKKGISITPTRDPKDVVVNLPLGLLGDPAAVPRCPIGQVTDTQEPCPDDTQIGVFTLDFGEKQSVGPIVNVAPEPGQSAEFAIEFAKEPFLITAHLVHTTQGVSGCITVDGCYGFTVVSDGQPIIGLHNFELTFWGVPADPSHDKMRGLRCNSESGPIECQENVDVPYEGSPAVPFLSMPTDCAAGPLTGTIRADSWEQPGSVREGEYQGYTEGTTSFPAVSGCNLLRFDAGIEVRPETRLADSPVGLEFDVKVRQNESPESPATPDLRDAVVTLPEGLSISPGVVDGVEACQESGPEGINFEGPESEEIGADGELQLAPGRCPGASTIGTAEAITPLLTEPVKGHVYLAQPRCGGSGQDPCTAEDAADGNLYQLYLELGGEGPLANTGINIKAHGYVEANPATGQLTTKFLENPQAPFSELKIHLNGGPRASLDNPSVCGPAVTTADFTPWSAPGITPEGLSVPGTQDVAVSSLAYNVEGCSNPSPLKPGFTAGTVTPQAGQFSAFTLNLSRQDREQYVKGLRVHTPAGLLGMLSSVPLCQEPEADSGHCPETSKIGTTRVASGAGSHPFEIDGDVYLTGPHDGAPFGLSIVTDAVAGPFNLGLVVVRARIEVEPETSELNIKTDETGPYAIPQIFDGVPLRLQRITVDVDRPNFMFNPTNCAEQEITATVLGSQQALVPVSSPFAVGGCKSLAFKPTLEVSTSAKTSRVNGASLDVKLSYPANSVGVDANIARTKVDLPRQLPSRLTTLQKACPAATFDANPAVCPKGSIVGIVRASTPVLPVGLSGPVYFVSHGGEAFPSLVVVLQGDGVRVDLTGTTFISKAGITSSTFKSVPDVPVHTFELYLPEGKDSALAANGKLCKYAGKLKMPTEFVAQNEAVIHQSTNITVTGCPKVGKTKTKPGKKT